MALMAGIRAEKRGRLRRTDAERAPRYVYRAVDQYGQIIDD
jgi:hypothetical protein